MGFDREKNSLLSELDAPAALAKIGSFQRAKSLQEKAASVGFDWQEIAPVFDKLHEEIDELKHEVSRLEDKLNEKERHLVRQDVEKEFGDLLFVCVNLSRFLDLDCEKALETTNAKFIRRFQYIEKILFERGDTFEKSSLKELDELWEEAKQTDN